MLALPHFERSLDFVFAPHESSSGMNAMCKIFPSLNLILMDTVKRWRDRWEEREGTTKEAWKELLEHQRQEKARQEEERKVEAEKLEAEIALERQNLSGLLDKAMPTSRFNGRSLKVIVKVISSCLLCHLAYQDCLSGSELYTQSGTGIRRDVAYGGPGRIFS